MCAQVSLAPALRATLAAVLPTAGPDVTRPSTDTGAEPVSAVHRAATVLYALLLGGEAGAAATWEALLEELARGTLPPSLPHLPAVRYRHCWPPRPRCAAACAFSLSRG